METSEEINKLATALALFQGKLTPIKRTETVKVQTTGGGSYSFNYCPLDQIIETCRPLLLEQGLAVTQMLGEGGKITTMIMHNSGQWISSTFGIDAKGTPQQIGSAITYARRYAYTSALGISNEEDDDANSASGNTYTKAKAAPAAKAAEKAGPTKWLNKWKDPKTMRETTDEWKKMVGAIMEKKTTVEQIEGLRKLNKEDKMELAGIEASSVSNPKN